MKKKQKKTKQDKTNKQTNNQKQFQDKTSNTKSENVTQLDYIAGWKSVSLTTVRDSKKQLLVSEFEGSGYLYTQHWAYYQRIIFHLKNPYVLSHSSKYYLGPASCTCDKTFFILSNIFGTSSE